ncbi:MAG TPA: HNH endonuclease signature motif containing protein [Ilumatobacter sp.]|nr:HNH endonuclease signature motif containing protein [Ilumatobacter sp.]
MTTGVAASEISVEMDDVGLDDAPAAEFSSADSWNAELEDAELLEELEIADRHCRQLMAHQTMLIAEVMRRKLYRKGGHSSVFGLLRARLGWSEGECRDAVAIVRAAQVSPSMSSAVDNATLPVSHSAALARSINALAKSPTAAHEGLDREVASIIADREPEYDQFAKSVRRLESISDPTRSQRSADAAHDRRDVTIRPTEHGVTITARLGAVDGARAIETIYGFADAEHETDRRVAMAEGNLDEDGFPIGARSAAQCRADGFSAICDSATTAAPARSVTVAPVSVLVDERTFKDTLAWFGLYPETAHDPFTNPRWSKRRCETSNGIVVDPATAVREAIAGHLRWMMVDQLLHPLAISSQQRCFRGPLREAVLQISDRCVIPGCRQPTGRLQADHVAEHHAGGETSLANGIPLCGRHNRLKHREGLQPRQDELGHWHLYDRFGNLLE